MDTSKIPKIAIESARDFVLSLPGTVKKEWLEGVDTNFHFDIEGEGGGQFSIIVKDNQLRVFEHFEGEPRCKITAKEHNLIKLLRGEMNPMMAVLTGKVKISNTSEIIKYAKLFGIM